MKTNLLALIIVAIYMVTGCKNEKENSPNTYYINSELGNDANVGTSPEKAWKTIEKINITGFHAGEKVLLQGGQTFNGSIHISSLRGTAKFPIEFNTYGKGKATILSGDSLAFLATDCQYIVLKNIIAKGSGRLKGNRTNGIEFFKVHNGTIDSVEASGYLWSGIQISGGENIRITHANAHDNGFCGINVDSGEKEYGEDGSKYKTLRNVYVGHCIADNNPGCPEVKDNHSGSGILLGGVVNGLVEFCEAMNNGWDMPREGNGPVGIWAYMSDSIIIQHCYAHHNKTSLKGKDGGGFDFDGGITNSILQYNFSAFNEGAGYGIFQYAGATEWSNNIARYNISYNDGSKNSQAGILMWCDPIALPMKKFHAYNSTIVNNFKYGVNFEPGVYKDFLFENNIFLVTPETDKFIGGDFKLATFQRNAFWAIGNESKGLYQPQVILDKSAIIADPNLNLPTIEDILKIDMNDVSTIQFFKLNQNSVCLKSGNVISANGGRDFWGKEISSEAKPNIGADGE